MFNFSNLTASEPEQTELGETSVVSVSVSMIVSPQYICCADYSVDFLVGEDYVNLPIRSIGFNENSVQKSLPMMSCVSNTDNISLSSISTISLEYVCVKNNAVVEMLAKDSMKKSAKNHSDKAKNNKVYQLRLTRMNEQYIYNLKVKSHDTKIVNGIEDQGASVVFVTTGDEYGA